MRLNLKRAILGAVLMIAIAFTAVTAGVPGCEARAKSNGITYKNEIFTKNLYKKTQKIGFGADGSLLLADKKYVKKVYKLLAKMELKEADNKDGEQSKSGFVTLVIHKKGGGKKTYTFCGDKLRTGTKVYTIVKNNPVKKLQEIYTPGGKAPVIAGGR